MSAPVRGRLPARACAAMYDRASVSGGALGVMLCVGCRAHSAQEQCARETGARSVPRALARNVTADARARVARALS